MFSIKQQAPQWVADLLPQEGHNAFPCSLFLWSGPWSARLVLGSTDGGGCVCVEFQATNERHTGRAAMSLKSD